MQSYGPVENLEDRLEPDWWKKIFNATYLKTDGDVVQDDNITRHEVTYLLETIDLQKTDTILDLACGQGRHIIELARQGFTNLSGLDQSAYLIDQARNTADKEELDITFTEGDSRHLPYETGSFDCVMILGNSFGYFEKKDEDKQVLKEVLRVLKPEGNLLMDIADGGYLKDNFTKRSWEWIDKTQFVCRERSLATDQERLISREVVSDINEGVIVDQFYAERLYSEKSLSELLQNTGFDNICNSSTIEPKSLRNQDLGMMEKRFLITANRGNTQIKKKKKKATKNIVVLMGDPSQKDIIKPDAVFDEDDLNTIHMLEEALGELDSYNFHYLNDHSSLVDDLRELSGDIDLVLNFCDEGFNNDAAKELHIPALLEILDIPYTGSRPQNLTTCYDKALIRAMASQLSIPIADGHVICAGQNCFDSKIPFPVIVKPNYGDSSLGITQESVLHAPNQLNERIHKMRQQFGYQKPVLVEEFLPGAELTIGIIGNPPDKHFTFPILQEDYSNLPDHLPKICGYEAKWLTDSLYFKNLKSIPADLPPETGQKIIDDSLTLFERLQCRDYARFDWRLNALEQPKLLEVNPNPGWCWDGHLAKMAQLDGMSYSNMLGAILKAAEKRIAKK